MKKFFDCSSLLFLATLCIVGWLTGCDSHDREPPPSPTTVDLPVDDNETFSAKPRKIAETVTEEVDLIGDKPEAATALKKTLLEELKPQEPLDRAARKAYALMADIRTNLESIRKDLDDNGKEITRLIHTSDLLAKNITSLKNLWADNATFHDICGSAKGRVLLLNTELSRTPRKWTHIRWAFNFVVQELRRLCAAGVCLAEAEPKPVAVVGKDGRISYVEPVAAPVDPRIAEKDRKLREVEEAKKKLKRYEEAKKNKPMRIDLDEK
ncbi:MAG: hypothetical protein V1899_11135 [Planctomycetota bacterium]